MKKKTYTLSHKMRLIVIAVLAALAVFGSVAVLPALAEGTAVETAGEESTGAEPGGADAPAEGPEQDPDGSVAGLPGGQTEEGGGESGPLAEGEDAEQEGENPEEDDGPRVDFVFAELRIEQHAEEVDLLDGASAQDEAGGSLELVVLDDGGLDVEVPGIYTVVYQADHPELGEVTAEREVEVCAPAMRMRGRANFQPGVVPEGFTYYYVDNDNVELYAPGDKPGEAEPAGYTTHQGDADLTGGNYTLWLAEGARMQARQITAADNLTICGTGELQVAGQANAVALQVGGTLAMEGGQVTVTGAPSGKVGYPASVPVVLGSLNVDGGSLELTADASDTARVAGDVNVAGGSLQVRSSKAKVGLLVAGNLRISGGLAKGTGEGTGIQAANIYVTGGSLCADMPAGQSGIELVGLQADGVLEVTGGSVNAQADPTHDRARAIVVKGESVLLAGAGSSLTADGGLYGMVAENATVTVRDGAVLEGSSDAGLKKYGTAVAARNLVVINATVTGSSPNMGYGVKTGESILVDAGTITGTGMVGVGTSNGNITLQNGARIAGNSVSAPGGAYSVVMAGVQLGGGKDPSALATGGLYMSGASQIETYLDDQRSGTYLTYGVKFDIYNRNMHLSEGSVIRAGFSGQVPTHGLFINHGDISLNAASIFGKGTSHGVQLDGGRSLSPRLGSRVRLVNGSVIEGHGQVKAGENKASYGINIGMGMDDLQHILYVDASSKMVGKADFAGAPAGAVYHVGICITAAQVRIEGSISGTAQGYTSAMGIWISDSKVEVPGGSVSGHAQNTGGGKSYGVYISATNAAVDPVAAYTDVNNGGRIVGQGGYAGVMCSMKLVVAGQGSAVAGSTLDNTSAYGVYVARDAVVSGGAELTAQTVPEAGRGLYVDRDLSVLDGGKVQAQGSRYGATVFGKLHVAGDASAIEGTVLGAAQASYGLYAGTLAAEDKAFVHGVGNAALNSAGIVAEEGIWADDAVVVGASDDVGILLIEGNLYARNGADITAAGSPKVAGGCGLVLQDSDPAKASLFMESGATLVATGGWRGAHVGGHVQMDDATLEATGASADAPDADAAGAWVGDDVELTGGSVLVAKALAAQQGYSGIHIDGASVVVDASHLDAWTEHYDNTGVPAGYAAINIPNVTHFVVKGDGTAEEHYNTTFIIGESPVDPAGKDPAMGLFTNYTWKVGAPGQVDKNADASGLVGAANSGGQVLFEAWRTGADKAGSGEPVQLQTPGSRHIIRYGGATTSAPFVTLRFDANGGHGAPADQHVKSGQAPAQPSEKPLRDMHGFTGWYADAACTQAFDFSKPLATDAVAYAGWTRTHYQVRYIAEGSTSGSVPADETAASGTRYTVAPQVPGREGYAFAGWTCDADGRVYRAGESFLMPAKDVTMSAVWNQTHYRVRYVSTQHDSGGVPDGALVESGTRYGVSPGMPGRTGYTFAGWESDADGRVYFAGDDFVMPAQDVTLTATWAPGTSPVSPVSRPETSQPENPQPPEPADEQPVSDSTQLNPAMPNTEVTGNFGDPDAPGGGIGKGGWSLLNLMLSILGLVVALLLVVRILRRRKAEEEQVDSEGTVAPAVAQNKAAAEECEEPENRRKKGGLWRLVAVLAGVLMPILFWILEDMRLPMTFVNRWTLLFLVLTVLMLLFLFMLRRAIRKERDEEEDLPEDEAAARA